MCLYYGIYSRVPCIHLLCIPCLSVIHVILNMRHSFAYLNVFRAGTEYWEWAERAYPPILSSESKFLP